ncbi:MAG TPA: WXG100 family type VII secretion target [Thermopolyspora sp.]
MSQGDNPRRPSGQSEIILANFDEMDEVASELARAYTDLAGEITDMEADLKVLETWAGAAGDVYREEQAKWTAAKNNIATTMERFGPVVQEAKEIMYEAERINTARWGT